jgi:triphosphatase
MKGLGGPPVRICAVPDHVETELKLDLPEDAPGSFKKLNALAGSTMRTKHLDTVYFDTRKFKLHRKGLSLRVRSDGKNFVQTVKSISNGASLAERMEWETPVDGIEPDLAAARGTALEPYVSEKLRRSLKPIFATLVERRIFPVKAGKAELEVALDRGWIESRKRTTEICEAEVELKNGDPSEVYDFARRLSAEVPLHLSVRSKADRGYSLANGSDEEPFDAGDVSIDRDASTAQAFRAIGTACLRQIAGNWKLVCRGDADGVHAMRVGLRRLRAAISLFSGMLADGQTERIKAELKWLTGELGHARQLEVFEKHVLEPLRDTHPGPGTERLAGALDEHRSEADARAKAAVLSRRFRALMLDTAEWLERGEWTKSGERLASAVKQRSALGYAGEELARRHRKIIKRGKRLRHLDERHRHKLRIAAKKLRYGTEFFASLFHSSKAAKRRKAFFHGLKGLQDCLGELNDIAAHRKLCAALAKEQSLEEASENTLSFVAGVAHGWEDRREKPALTSSERAYCRFRELKRPFQ